MFDADGGRLETRTGLLKWVTVFAVILGVSFGLCGLTAIATISFSMGSKVLVLAYIELAGMLVGLVGLVVIGLIAIVKAIVQSFGRPQQGE